MNMHVATGSRWAASIRGPLHSVRIKVLAVVLVVKKKIAARLGVHCALNLQLVKMALAIAFPMLHSSGLTWPLLYQLR